MTDTVKEQLSACLDSQLRQDELDLLLKRVAKDRELRRTLGRYALTGEALRGSGAVRASTGFADRVSAAVAAEDGSPQRSVRIAPSVVRWLRPAAGFAVAAGVATVAVLSLQPSAPESNIIAQAPPAASASNDSYIVPANTVSNFVPATRLTNYVVAHSEYSSPLGLRTVLSGVLSEEDEAAAAAESAEDVSQDAFPDDASRNAAGKSGAQVRQP
ncbi:MAG: sigma-E factor negative regulatory protein [Steroidobacteraceae bacterium]